MDDDVAEVEYVRDLKNYVDKQSDEGTDELMQLCFETAYPTKKSQDC